MPQTIALPTLEEIDAEKCRRSLAYFIKASWHVLEPTTKLNWNWHIEAIALHVQTALEEWMAVQEDETFQQRIQNLLINVPPGTMKSRIVSVCTPAWMWLHCPSWRAMFLSANPRVALRDSVYCRDLVESDWYQRMFRPDWELRDDQNAKSSFWNTAGGFRNAFGFNSRITGDRADALFVDDPHDADEVKSDIMREGVLQRWDDAIGNRVNDLRSSLRIGIMQRLHEADWSGHILVKEAGSWAHLCLPMEYEPERYDAAEDYIPRVTPIGWSDPRTTPGELLFPQRFTPAVLAKELARLMDAGYAGQYQQRPSSKEGGFFKVGKFEYIDASEVPHDLRLVRGWDKAATEGGGAYTVGVLMGTRGDGRFYILDVVRGQWGTDKRDAMIRKTAEQDGKAVVQRGPEDPGQAGKGDAQAFARLLQGFIVRVESVSGSKELRADPYSSQVNAGNVHLVRGAWNKAFTEEHRLFPNGKLKDQIDAAADAFNELTSHTPTRGKNRKQKH